MSRLQARDITKLRLGQLEALESNDIAALPPPMFLRGHLRVYASELGLDADDIVGRYLDQFNISTSSGSSGVRTAEPTRTARGSLLRLRAPFARVAMLAIIMVVGLLFLHSPARARNVATASAPEPVVASASAPVVTETRATYTPPRSSPSFVAVAARSRSITYATLGR